MDARALVAYAEAGGVLVAGVLGGEHVAFAVIAGADFGVAAARALPCDNHRAVIPVEDRDVERLFHRRIVDAALVEDFAGLVRSELVERASGHPFA